MKTRLLAFLCLSTLSLSASEPPAALRDIHRIVFLGDSITQAGTYVTDFDCWLVSKGLNIEVLCLGLASETASDLTSEENADHLKTYGFSRPSISERLGRVLAATKPDLVIACYGMNDCSSLPPDESGTKRYADAMTQLRDSALKAGAKHVVLCSPPVKDSMKAEQGTEDENISRYTTWLLSKKAEGWDIVDIHTPMRKELDAAREKDPKFLFSPDGVHPGKEGHWLMAREILTQFLGANLTSISSPEALFPANGSELVKLVDSRRDILFNAWMFQTGHKRPGSPGGPNTGANETFKQSIARANAISKQIIQSP